MWARLAALVADLRRRKVFQVTSIYLVTAWGAALGVSELSQTFDVEQIYVRAFVIGLVVMLPVVAALAWYFDITPAGIVRDRHTLILPTTVTTSCLQVVWSGHTGTESRIFETPFMMGRDAQCDVHTLEPNVSRQHARVELRDEEWWIVDMGSSNGTWVDGNRVDEARLTGDVQVKLGDPGQLLSMRVLDQGATTVAKPITRGSNKTRINPG